MHNRLVHFIRIAFLTGVAFAQSSSTLPSFEVASVKASAPGGRDSSFTRGVGGRFSAKDVPLKSLITFAYDIRDQQLSGGPEWIGDARFDIIAKPDGFVPLGPQGDATLKLMLRALLSDRFHLVVHRQAQEMAAYALVVARGGPKLFKSAPETKGPSVNMGRGQIRAVKASTDRLAQILSNQLGRPVVDETGLTADYDFNLQYTPRAVEMKAPMEGETPIEKADAPLDSGITIFTALEEQLGLRLVTKKRIVEIVFVDHVEKPSEN